MITPPTLLDALIVEAMWAAAIEAGAQPATAKEPAALRRSLWHAQRDIGQSGVEAEFQLAGWHAVGCGGLDRTPLGARDAPNVADMTVVVGPAGRVHRSPDRMGCEATLTNLVRTCPQTRPLTPRG